jgi:hypothetical protein
MHTHMHANTEKTDTHAHAHTILSPKKHGNVGAGYHIDV